MSLSRESIIETRQRPLAAPHFERRKFSKTKIGAASRLNLAPKIQPMDSSLKVAIRMLMKMNGFTYRQGVLALDGGQLGSVEQFDFLQGALPNQQTNQSPHHTLHHCVPEDDINVPKMLKKTH